MHQHTIDNTFNVWDFLHQMKIHSLFILAFSLGLAGVTYWLSDQFITPMYGSTATLIVNNRDVSFEYGSISSDELNSATRLAELYSVLIKSDAVILPVLQETEMNIGVSELVDMLTVEAIEDTQVFSLTVLNQDPEVAYRLTQAFLAVVPGVIETLVYAGSVQVVSYPQLNRTPVSPNSILNASIAFMFGLTLYVGIVFLRILFVQRFKTPRDVERYSGLTVLGQLPYVKR